MSSSAMTLETPSFTDLNTIKPFKTTWRIQVKIVHSWKQYNTYVGESLDMILSDISGTLIHATVKKQQVSKFQRLVVPGEWRIIENFTLSKAMGRFRATKHVYRMSLMNTTSIVPCASLSEDMYLELVDFATVLNDPSLDENLLIDVIGQVVNVGELTTHDVANKTKKKLEFELRDSKDERLVCTLWDNFAEEMLAVCEKKRGKTFICLLRFAKVNSFKGERSISNAFDMSLLQIDPDLPEANKFRERLPKDGLALTIKRGVPKEEKKVRKADFYKRFPSLTIAELIDITEEGKYKIMCTVYAIDTEFAWYYFVCLKCNTTVYKVPKVEDDVVKTNKKAIFWCSGCQQYHSKVEPRFKLILCVMDSTGQTKCVLFESDAQMIVYQSAVQLLNGELEEIQDPNNIPQSLQNLVGKTFQFVVSVEKVHIRDRKDTYKVSHAFLGTDIEKANAYEAPEDDDLITIVSGDQEPPTLSSSIENGELPCTPSTTPSSKRKDEASAESSDDSSSSKKVCVESIAKAIDDEHVEGDEGNE